MLDPAWRSCSARVEAVGPRGTGTVEIELRVGVSPFLRSQAPSAFSASVALLVAVVNPLHSHFLLHPFFIFFSSPLLFPSHKFPLGREFGTESLVDIDIVVVVGNRQVCITLEAPRSPRSPTSEPAVQSADPIPKPITDSTTTHAAHLHFISSSPAQQTARATRPTNATVP